MTWTCSTPNWPPGRTPPTRTSGKSTGTSPPATPGPDSATSTQNIRSDALLGWVDSSLAGRQETFVGRAASSLGVPLRDGLLRVRVLHSIAGAARPGSRGAPGRPRVRVAGEHG